LARSDRRVPGNDLRSRKKIVELVLKLKTRACLGSGFIILLFAACNFWRGTPLSAEIQRTLSQTALDLAGHPVNPLERTNSATVLIFVSVDCPISNKYAPEIQRLKGVFEKQNVMFWMVYPEADTLVAEIKEHVREFGLGDRILRDPSHFLVKKARATVTPEAAIFDRNRRLVYFGRIDNRFVALGQARTEATYRDLEQNLNLLLQGKPIPQKQTKAIGCHISGLN
jgi:hypothetical protein